MPTFKKLLLTRCIQSTGGVGRPSPRDKALAPERQRRTHTHAQREVEDERNRDCMVYQFSG